MLIMDISGVIWLAGDVKEPTYLLKKAGTSARFHLTFHAKVGWVGG